MESVNFCSEQNGWSGPKGGWRWLMAALIGLVTTAAPTTADAEAATKGFALQVNDVSGLGEPWPLVGGLPFPEGELHDPSRIRITRDGVEVPAQLDVAATWRDGSIRWALAGFTGSPQAAYRVEFGPGVGRSAAAVAATVRPLAGGGWVVDTGPAVYEFAPDRLLPERVTMGAATVLTGSGDGAYLVDNQGRRSRVAGARAEVASEIVREGPARVVLRREGWYVTPDGVRVARARAWFYFAAGSPYLRVTHSLILTENTNEIWVRDYGLEFRTAAAPQEVVFALREATAEELAPVMSDAQLQGEGNRKAVKAFANLFSGADRKREELFAMRPAGAEVYLLQDKYPHFLDRDCRAVLGRVEAGRAPELLRETGVAGDWGDAVYDGHGLTVVLPGLAQSFPKEIAFGPSGARVALWSGRSGRELDFRAATLVREYWKDWAELSREGSTLLSMWPSNAQGAARTHDVWLLPRPAELGRATVQERARAAAHPPLLQAEPEWQTATEAVGWPMHPRDEARFPVEEAVLSDFWDGMMARHAQLRRTGFIAWGGTPHIRGAGAGFFRVARLVDYGLRRNVWGLYVRSGERRYQEFGARYNRFAGDLELAHWTVGRKFKGGFAGGTDYREPFDAAERARWESDSRMGRSIDVPFYWGDYSGLIGGGDITGHAILNWLLEYYTTGDEYPRELARLVGEAYRERESELTGVPHAHLGVLSALYAHEWDEAFRRMAREQTERLIDLNSPNALNDELPVGMYYKVSRDLVALYDYYRATGDERARVAILKGIDDKYRFHHTFDRSGIPGERGAFGGQNYVTFLFSIAYQWTGRTAYLRVVNRLIEDHRKGPTGSSRSMSVHYQMNPFMGVPTALRVLAREPGPIAPFPLLEATGPGSFGLRKDGNRPVEMRVYVRMAETLHEDTPARAVLRSGGTVFTGLEVTADQMFKTRNEPRRDPRRWHLHVRVPASVPAGRYTLEFPGAGTVAVLESDAPELTAR